MACWYIVSQCVGAILGAMVGNSMTGRPVTGELPAADTMLELNNNMGTQIMPAEFFGTFMYTMVFLACASITKGEYRNNGFFGLAVGFTVFALGMSLGTVSG